MSAIDGSQPGTFISVSTAADVARSGSTRCVAALPHRRERTSLHSGAKARFIRVRLADLKAILRPSADYAEPALTGPPRSPLRGDCAPAFPSIADLP